MPQRALITGFEPFGPHRVNPSQRLALALDGKQVAGFTIRSRVLPVVFAGLGPHIEGMLDDVRPDLVIGLGLAPGENEIRLERFAVNLADAEIPDNAGSEPRDEPIIRGGAVAYAASLKLRKIAAALVDAGIKMRLSNSAGTFVCNAALYHFLAAVARRGWSIPCGFIHLPDLPEQAGPGAPAMKFVLMEQALSLALETCGGAMARSDQTP